MALAVAGVVVLVVAIVALRGPSRNAVEAGTQIPTGPRGLAGPTATASGAGSSGAGPSGAGSSGTDRPAPRESRSGGATAAGGAPASAPSSSSPSVPPSTRHVVTHLPLVVLNNTTITGLAEGASERFELGGWTVTAYANYRNDILSTCAYFDPGVSGARAAALALQRQYPTIRRVLPQFSGLESWHSPIVVILTPDYAP